MSFISKNPFTKQLIKKIPYVSQAKIKTTIEELDQTYQSFRLQENRLEKQVEDLTRLGEEIKAN